MIRDEYRALDTLLPNTLNYNRHDEQNVATLASQIAEVGFTAPFLVDAKTGIIEAGHRRRLALLKLRAENHGEPEGVQPGWQVPCRVGEWTELQRLKVLVGDNPDPARLDYDGAGLTALLAELERQGELGGSGYDDAALDRLISELADTAPTTGLLPDADPDEVPEAAEVEGRCRAGDLWACGVHRVLCGDSTRAEDVERLMGGATADACVTDPPYNVGLGYDDATDDEKAAEDYRSFSLAWWELVTAPVRVVTPGWNNLALWLSAVKPQAMGVWTKLNSMTRASATRFNCWEPLLFYGCKNSDRAHDVFDFPTSIHFGGAGSGIADPHPCPKPVALWRELLTCYTPEGAVLYEPFTGSGTTIIAAEETGRKCYGMEHSPHYVDITLARFEKATGRTAELLDRIES